MNENSDYDVLKLINDAKKGDKEARDILVEKNIGLVWSVVRRFQNRGHEADDLFQIGCIGLIKSIQKFDATYKVKFSTYAVPMIMGEIKRFIRDDGIIKVSRSLKETANKARMAKETLEKDKGREPSVQEIANYLEIEVEDLVMAMEANNSPDSLHSTLHEGDGNPILLIDRVEEDEDQEDRIIDKILLKQVIENLKPRERQIIILRYFKEKTQVQIAEMLGISQVQVSRIEKKLLTEMRKKIKVI